MRYGRKGKNRAGNGDGSFWICFSDLMSALMLVFVLVMFYSEIGRASCRERV